MKTLLALLSLLLTNAAHATTAGIVFIHQPITTMGTDQDTAIIPARIPTIAVGPLEAIFQLIALPNRLVQNTTDPVEDSNLLSSLAITISAEWIEKPEHYIVTLDLTKMTSTDDYELTPDAVVKVAVDCIRLTIDEHGKGKRWKIKITARPDEAKKWAKYTGDYTPKRKK